MSALAALGALESVTGGAAEGGLADSRSDSFGSTDTGDKVFNIGANPNVKTTNNAMILISLVAVVWLMSSKSSKK
jgi:hypothetical protein